MVPGIPSSLLTAHCLPLTAGAVIGALICLGAILFQAAPAHADAIDMLKKTYAGIQTVEAQFEHAMEIVEDLRTRLAWGYVYQLHPLSDEEKTAALLAQ